MIRDKRGVVWAKTAKMLQVWTSEQGLRHENSVPFTKLKTKMHPSGCICIKINAHVYFFAF